MKTLRIVFALVALVAISPPGASAQSPNIVVILADDLGYGDVKCFNPEGKIETPNIDRLASQGMRFTDAHAGGSVCVPSRYALLTGRFAAREKLSVPKGPVIAEGMPTLASLLRESGYTTAMVGKWHQGFVVPRRRGGAMFDFSKPLRGGPVDRGFDTFFGMHASLDIPPYFYIEGRRPVERPTGTIVASTSIEESEGWNKIQGAFWRSGRIAPDFQHAEVTPRFAREAVNVIEAHAESEKPLFLYVALPSPHTPWLPSEEFVGASGAGSYGDFVMQVDSVVGRLASAIESAGMADNTLVIFSSDNGPVWYEKDVEKFGHRSTAGLRGMKFSPHEGGHRVPFIAKWPGKVPAETISEQTIVFSDLYATFAHLVGNQSAQDSRSHDGVSFLDHLLATKSKRESRPAIVHDNRTLRDGRWKLIAPSTGSDEPMQLYDLHEDRYEKNNLATMHPEVVEQLTEKLRSILVQ